MSSARKWVEEETLLTEIRDGYKVGSSKAVPIFRCEAQKGLEPLLWVRGGCEAT